MSIGQRIKQRRKELGMSQSDLADLLGVSKGTVGNYESEVSHPTAFILSKLFIALDCDANYLYQDYFGLSNQNGIETQKVTELSIPNALKRLREMSGFTINEVGEIVGKSGKTVSAWENGRGQPDIETLITLSHLYNVDNILSVFETDNGHLKEDNMILSDHEIALIKAYRDKTNMQEAVDKLLDIL